MSGTHTKVNLRDVEDLAPKFGMESTVEARFARGALGAQRIGMAHYRVKPDERLGFGHRHREAEEVYVVLSGSGRFRVDDEVFEVGAQDVVYCPPDAMRALEAGPDGLELLASGQHVEEGDAEMAPGWWGD